MDPLRTQRRASRLAAAISLVLHGGIIALLMFLAAREGMLGTELRKIAVTIVPREKPPEPPTPKPAEPKPVPAPAPVNEPTPAPAAPPAAPENRTGPGAPDAGAPPPPPATGGELAAPPPNELPGFAFDDGKAVATTSDARQLYRSYMEFTLRSHWTRPAGVADEQFVAEVEVALDESGRILGTTWERGSGHAAWDESVRQALAATTTIGRAPPAGFPSRVRVRFDVLPVSPLETN